MSSTMEKKTKKILINPNTTVPTQIILSLQAIYNHSTLSKNSKSSTSNSTSLMSVTPEKERRGNITAEIVSSPQKT